MTKTGDMEVRGDITVSGDVIVGGTLGASKIEILEGSDNASIGKSILPEGEQSLTIYTNAVTNNSKVIVTFQNNYRPATRYWIDKITTGESFTLRLDQPVNNDTKFSWWIVN